MARSPESLALITRTRPRPQAVVSPVGVTGGKTPYEHMYSGLPLIADIARSAFHRIHAVFGRAMPCSAVAQQRHKIIRNGVALAGEESVSVGHRRHSPPGRSGEPTHAHLHHWQ